MRYWIAYAVLLNWMKAVKSLREHLIIHNTYGNIYNVPISAKAAFDTPRCIQAGSYLLCAIQLKEAPRV